MSRTLTRVVFAIVFFIILFFSGFSEDFAKEDVYKVSQLLRVILDSYTKMEFEKILPMSEGKAKRDFQRIILEVQNPQRYGMIKKEIDLLRNPTIKEVKIYKDENLALAIVEWDYKRSVPRGKDVETVDVRRETSYLFKKFGNEWKIISYR
ncbi:MAG: hypothetical protein RMJ37_03800 [Spirochaetia bacterium]|nr:hypothetical protein [Spirochaetota bacterium]MCX8096908.1 hypothetical protein [Spirochaetota bacterium]MDW8112451.1 hypothetical protein [Spirochaetia bacterium]